MAPAKVGGPPFTEKDFGAEYALFDRNREPPDQPRDLVQTIGIVVLDCLRKPNDTLVITHRWHVARHDRRHRPDEIGLEFWHRITLWQNPEKPSVAGKCAFLGLGSWQPRAAGQPGEAPDRDVRIIEKSNKSSRSRQFPPVVDAASEPPIWSFATPGGFVIRCPFANGFRLFLGSSAVEHSTVNRMVAGSNPARGAKWLFSGVLYHLPAGKIPDILENTASWTYVRGSPTFAACGKFLGVSSGVPGRRGSSVLIPRNLF